jgi:hypothetical protein
MSAPGGLAHPDRQRFELSGSLGFEEQTCVLGSECMLPFGRKHAENERWIDVVESKAEITMKALLRNPGRENRLYKLTGE